MNLYLFRALCVWLFFLSYSCNSLYAQAKGAGFSCVAWEKLPYEELYYRKGESFLPLNLYVGHRSSIYNMTKGGFVEFYIQELDDEGKTKYVLVAKAPKVEGSKRMLFILMKSTKASAALPLKVFSVDDSLAKFPAGSIRFVNFTNQPLKVLFAGSNTTLPARDIKVVDTKVSKGGHFLPFYVKDAEDRTVYSTRIIARATGRDMLFILPPTRKDELVSIRSIQHSVPKLPAKTVEQ